MDEKTLLDLNKFWQEKFERRKPKSLLRRKARKLTVGAQKTAGKSSSRRYLKRISAHWPKP